MESSIYLCFSGSDVHSDDRIIHTHTDLLDWPFRDTWDLADCLDQPNFLCRFRFPSSLAACYLERSRALSHSLTSDISKVYIRNCLLSLNGTRTRVVHEMQPFHPLVPDNLNASHIQSSIFYHVISSTLCLSIHWQVFSMVGWRKSWKIDKMLEAYSQPRGSWTHLIDIACNQFSSMLPSSSDISFPKSEHWQIRTIS